MNTKIVLIFIVNSILLATGIILVLIPCIQYSNWWPLITIFVHFFAVMFPVTCGGCAISENQADMDLFLDTNSNNNDLPIVSWLFVGLFVVLGYAIPAILLRAGDILQIGMFFAFAGGTLILISILIFVRVIYYRKDSNNAYMI